MTPSRNEKSISQIPTEPEIWTVSDAMDPWWGKLQREPKSLSEIASKQLLQSNKKVRNRRMKDSEEWLYETWGVEIDFNIGTWEY